MSDNICFITEEESIQKFFKSGFESDGYKGWKYDLALGDHYYISSREVPKILTEFEPHVIIRPGEFALLITEEYLEMSLDVMAFISVRFTYKQKGLINISGFHVDPGYKGKIIFSVYNAGPNDILLKKGERVFMIFFQNIGKKIEKKATDKNFVDIPMEMISLIQGKSVSLATNAARLDKLEHSIKFYGGVALSVILILIGVLLSQLLGGN